MTLQLASDGRLRHLLTLEGLPRSTLLQLLDRAGQIRDAAVGRVGKRTVLAGSAVCTLFFEPSTRTRSSFHLAAQRLGADVLNFDASTSSTRKGETARDTLRNLEAMGVRGFIVRHADDGAVAALAAEAGEGTALVNAGDGRSAHPTQGLLDVLTIRQAKGADFSRLKILMVGDVKHSRVARSDLHALRTLGAGEIRVCGPQSLLPDDGTLKASAATAERFIFLSRQAAQEEAASDAPPRVVAIVAMGGRRGVYLGGDGPPQRLSIGSSAGGWVLVAAGGNYADFSRSGTVKRVRLFQEQAGTQR